MSVSVLWSASGLHAVTVTCWTQDSCVAGIRTVERWLVSQQKDQWHIDVRLHAEEDGHLRIRDIDADHCLWVLLQHNGIIHDPCSVSTRQEDLEKEGNASCYYEMNQISALLCCLNKGLRWGKTCSALWNDFRSQQHCVPTTWQILWNTSE